MIRILIADSSGLTCDAMRKILENEDDFYVVGCVRTVEELHYLLPHSNLVLITSALEDKSAIELVADIREMDADVKTVVAGLEKEPELILRYIEAGADGYVLQHESTDKLVYKTRAIYMDKTIISPKMTTHLVERVTELANQSMPLAEASEKASSIEELTPREMEVLGLVGEGLTNQEIADRLVIGCGTVKNHVHNILKKLEAENRHEAAAVYEVYHEKHDVLSVTN